MDDFGSGKQWKWDSIPFSLPPQVGEAKDEKNEFTVFSGTLFWKKSGLT